MEKEKYKKFFDNFQFGGDGVIVSHFQYTCDTLILGKKSWKIYG